MQNGSLGLQEVKLLYTEKWTQTNPANTEMSFEFLLYRI